MKKKAFYAVLTLTIASAFLFSCQKDVNKENTAKLNKPLTATIYLTDHQTPIFDSVFIDLKQFWIKLDDDTLQNDGWVNMNIRHGVYNILRFRNGIDTLFATGNLPSARLKKIKMILGTQNSVMENGKIFPLIVKDNDREVVLNLEANNFEFHSSGNVLFWIDFDAGNSIQLDNSSSGNLNGYRLRSHIRIFTRSQSGRIEGKVFPSAADPIVKAIIGTDTVTAIPERDGEYKIVGLSAGVYSVYVDGQNGYSDTILQNVIVRNREDFRLPTITLR